MLSNTNTMPKEIGTASLLAESIATIILENRKPAENECCDGATCGLCLEYMKAKVAPFITAGKPVQMIMAAFPYKVAWPVKTLSPQPDMAERLAFYHLHKNVGSKIADVYRPGADIIIGSDGYPFYHVDCRYNEEFSVEMVHAYLSGCRTILRDIGASSIRILSLDDFYLGDDYEQKRMRLIAEHSTVTEAEIDSMVQDGGVLNNLYKKMKNHMDGDLFSSPLIQSKLQNKTMSKNDVHREAGRATRETLWISEAYRNLLSTEYPNAIRLSIHPEPLHDALKSGKEKLGVEFGDDRNLWYAELPDTCDISPWYSVAVIDEETDRYCRMKRSEAERIGAELVTVNDVPSHFIMRSCNKPT